MKYRHSLQQKIFALSVLLILIPMSVYMFFMVRTTVESARKNYADYAALSMRKTGAVLDNVFGDLERASLFLIGSNDIRAYLAVEKGQLLDFSRTERPANAFNTLRYLRTSSEYIASIQLLGLNSVMLSSGPLPMGITQADMKRADALSGRALWGVEEGTGRIFLCRLLRDYDHPERKLGFAKLYLDAGRLLEFLRGEEGDDHTAYYLLDGAGETCLALDPLDAAPAILSDREALARLGGGSERVRSGGTAYYATAHTVGLNGWTLVGLSYSEAAHAQTVSSVTLLAVMGLAAVLLCLSLAYLLSRRLLGPLREMAGKMKSVGEEDFSVRIAVRGEDEVAQLAGQFNRMAAKISALIDEVYKAGLHKKEAELRALQAQINPHFLYNTLDMIYWTAKMERAGETSELISALSSFFRSGLSPAGEFTTVHNEVEHLRYYVILRQQSKGPIDFGLELEAEAEWCQTVKLVLQPLVENALVHGIGGREDGWVRVSIRREGDTLVYRIEDNGPGVDPEDMERLMALPLESTRGFGVQNVNDRIRLAYGPEYGLRFQNRPGGGTEATVVFPYVRGEAHAEADDCR